MKDKSHKCPNCGEHEHYYPSAIIVEGKTIIPDLDCGHCLHCDYDKILKHP